MADVRTLAKVRSLRYVFNLTPFFPLINHPVGLHIFQKPLTTVQVGPGRPSYPPVGLLAPIFQKLLTTVRVGPGRPTGTYFQKLLTTVRVGPGRPSYHPVGLHIFQKPVTTVQAGPGRPSFPLQ